MSDKTPVPGSDRVPFRNARVVGDAHPEERAQVTLVLRRKAALDPGKQISRDDFEKEYGASAEDITKVVKFAQSQNLTVVDTDPARRHVIVSGTVDNLEKAFGVELQEYAYDEGTYRGRTGAVHVPDDVHDAITAVLGLDNRPQARTHFRSRAERSLTPLQVASLYNFPLPAHAKPGSGQVIGLIELGGGYRPADLAAYFSSLGLGSGPVVTAVGVDGASNAPTGDPNGDDGEVVLDIEVAGAIASGAKIIVYFAPNTDQGFLNAITKAIHDNVHKPSVISISWGGPERSWTHQAMTAFDAALQDAAMLHVSVCVAAGDNGSSDGVGDGKNHVDFPASSPSALACGGTRLATSGSTVVETVWNDNSTSSATGGGISGFFKVPPYQAHVKEPGSGTVLTHRGVPDVAGNADPVTGYQVRVDGVNTVIGGTSAVAPLWAALIALLNQKHGTSAGFLNPTLYKALTDGTYSSKFRDIVSGNNGSFSASTGWDACTGLGSPNGANL